MSDTLDSKLDRLVCENWGLVSSLEERKERIIASFLESSLSEFKERDVYEELGGEGAICQVEGRWWKVEFVDRAVIWIRAVDDSPELAAEIFTEFKGAVAGSYRAIKDQIDDELRAIYGSGLDESGSRQRTVGQIVEATDPADLSSLVCDAVENQVPMLRWLRDAVARVAKQE